jgi:hypothetical protein
MGQSLSFNSVHLNTKNPKVVTTLKAILKNPDLVWGLLKIRGKNAENGNFFNSIKRIS